MKKSLLTVLSLALIFVMAVGVAAAAEIEPNDTKDNATAISVNENVTGKNETKQDKDYYKFTVASDGVFHIDFQHELFENSGKVWQIKLYDESGVNSIDGSSSYWAATGDQNLQTPDFGVKAGTYYVSVNPYTSSSYSDKEYNLTVKFTASDAWESENNNSKDTADVIAINKEISGASTFSSDEDWFKFTTTEDGYFNLAFSHELLDSSNTTWAVRLYDDTGVNYLDGATSIWAVRANKTGETANIGIKAGTYFVKVSPYGTHSNMNYSIKVNFTASKIWESENNHKKENADDISVNTEYFGAFSSGADVDWYKFTVEKDGFFTFELNHELVDNTSKCWSVYFYDESGVNFIDGTKTYWTWKGDQVGSIANYGIKAGTYYVKILPYSSSNFEEIDYSFKIKFTPADTWEKEQNNEKKNATSIELGSDWFGALTSSSDSDWYKLNLEKEEKLAVVFKHPMIDSTNNYWTITVYDETGITKILTENVKGNEFAKITPYAVLSPGTYYVKITSGGSYHSYKDYSINFSEYHECKGKTETTKEPTCTNKGTSESVCDSCGAVYSTEDIPALGHDYATWTVEKQATCTSTGQYVSECTRCKQKSYKTMDKVPHEYGEWTVKEEATCLSYGYQEHACKNCSRTETESIEPIGHTLGEWTVVKKADCFHEGLEEKRCIRCTYSEERVAKKTTHFYSNWERTAGNIIIQPIERTQTCQNCGIQIVQEDWSLIWFDILLAVLLVAGITVFVIIKTKKKKTPSDPTSALESENAKPEENTEDKPQNSEENNE